MRRHRLRAGLALRAGGALALGWWLLLAAPAGAQVRDCSATLNGQPHTRFNSPSNALRVPEDGQVQIVGTFSRETPGDEDLVYRVKLELVGAQWEVASGGASGDSWTDTVDVKDYATRGAGIYKVIAVTVDQEGNSCFGRAYIRVGDGGVLSTTAGKAGAATAAVAVVATAVAGARNSRGLDDLLNEGQDLNEEMRAAQGPTEAQEASREIESLKTDKAVPLALYKTCAAAAVVGAAATVRAMASEQASHVVGFVARLRR